MSVKLLPLLMNHYVLAIFLFSLGLGTYITCESSHWALAWIGIEIASLAILPLIAKNHHPRAIEATTKYFLLQATAAATILFAGIISGWLTGESSIFLTSHPLALTFLTLALTLKIGLAPFHFWMPEVLQGLDFTTGLILSTWQKLAPLAVLFQIQFFNSHIISAIGLSSILIGGWGGLNQVQLRKILGYSSIAHLGWTTLVLQFSPSLALLTLVLYFVITFTAFLTFKLNQATNINTLAISWSKNPTLATITPLVLLSLAGLPPLSGFISKWFVLLELTKQDAALIATVAALSALLSLYFYLRLAYAITLTVSPSFTLETAPWRLSTPQPKIPLALLAVITIGILPLATALITLTTI